MGARLVNEWIYNGSLFLFIYLSVLKDVFVLLNGPIVVRHSICTSEADMCKQWCVINMQGNIRNDFV